jgi:nucleoside-diphosphate-sugar epimerase
MTITSSGVAIVFGATGVSGSALCRQLVRDPIFRTVIGVCHRPLDTLDAQLGIVSGVDLLGELDNVVALLRDVKDISKVTHVFYAGYFFPIPINSELQLIQIQPIVMHPVSIRWNKNVLASP